MPDLIRPHDVTGLKAGELERARSDLHASLALARPGSAIRAPILEHLKAIDAEITERAEQDRISEVTS